MIRIMQVMFKAVISVRLVSVLGPLARVVAIHLRKDELKRKTS